MGRDPAVSRCARLAAMAGPPGGHPPAPAGRDQPPVRGDLPSGAGRTPAARAVRDRRPGQRRARHAADDALAARDRQQPDVRGKLLHRAVRPGHRPDPLHLLRGHRRHRPSRAQPADAAAGDGIQPDLEPAAPRASDDGFARRPGTADRRSFPPVRRALRGLAGRAHAARRARGGRHRGAELPLGHALLAARHGAAQLRGATRADRAGTARGAPGAGPPRHRPHRGTARGQSRAAPAGAAAPARRAPAGGTVSHRRTGQHLGKPGQVLRRRAPGHQRPAVRAQLLHRAAGRGDRPADVPLFGRRGRSRAPGARARPRRHRVRIAHRPPAAGHPRADRQAARRRRDRPLRRAIGVLAGRAADLGRQGQGRAYPAELFAGAQLQRARPGAADLRQLPRGQRAAAQAGGPFAQAGQRRARAPRHRAHPRAGAGQPRPARTDRRTRAGRAPAEVRDPARLAYRPAQSHLAAAAAGTGDAALRGQP